MLSVKFGLLFPHSLKPLLFYIQVLNTLVKFNVSQYLSLDCVLLDWVFPNIILERKSSGEIFFCTHWLYFCTHWLYFCTHWLYFCTHWLYFCTHWLYFCTHWLYFCTHWLYFDWYFQMLYIGNFLGLYLPYDFCFIGGVDPIWSFLPRFIPPLLVFAIPPFFLLFKRCALTHQHYLLHVLLFVVVFRARLKIWNGVWALVLLTYAPLCYTCVMLLNCPQLPHASSGEDDIFVST